MDTKHKSIYKLSFCTTIYTFIGQYQHFSSVYDFIDIVVFHPHGMKRNTHPHGNVHKLEQVWGMVNYKIHHYFFNVIYKFPLKYQHFSSVRDFIDIRSSSIPMEASTNLSKYGEWSITSPINLSRYAFCCFVSSIVSFKACNTSS